MNRRNFLKFLGVATIGSTVAYSFPSIIVPKNIEDISAINLIAKNEIYPKLIEDLWFTESPFFAYLRSGSPIITKSRWQGKETFYSQLNRHKKYLF